MDVCKIKSFLFRNWGYFIIAIVSALYIITGAFQIIETGKTTGQIIADGAIAFLLGFSMNRIFVVQGIMNGDRDERVVDAIKAHSDTVTKVYTQMDGLDAWCNVKNLENMRIQRTIILSGEGLKYSDYFNEDGSAKEFKIDENGLKNKHLKKIEKRRIKCVYQALRLKLTQLSSGELMSEGVNKNDRYYFGHTVSEFMERSALKDVVTKLLIGACFGYFTIRAVTDFNYIILLYNALQIGLFLIVGTMQMLYSFIFMVDEHRKGIAKKINILEEYWNYVQKLNKENNNIARVENVNQI